MNLDTVFYVFDQALPSRLCDDLVQYGLEKNHNIALTGDVNGKKQEELSEEDLAKLYKNRNSNVVWMDEPWIYNAIQPFVTQANINAGWNFQWQGSEVCQWTKYGKEQYYHWHQDSHHKPYGEETGWQQGLIRKLSVTVSLVDGNTYKGGDLELFYQRSWKDNKPMISEQARNKGSITVFPSFVWHRVSPVTEGTRYSLVIWNLGKEFV